MRVTDIDLKNDILNICIAHIDGVKKVVLYDQDYKFNLEDGKISKDVIDRISFLKETFETFNIGDCRVHISSKYKNLITKEDVLHLIGK